MIESDMLRYLDQHAYNWPEVIPSEIMRADKAPYRVYYRFMCMVYLMHRNGVLDTDSLKNIKSEFTKDFMLYNLYCEGAVKSAREFQKLDAALIDCRKNGNTCEFCRNVSAIHGAESTANEPDLIIPAEVG